MTMAVAGARRPPHKRKYTKTVTLMRSARLEKIRPAAPVQGSAGREVMSNEEYYPKRRWHASGRRSVF